MSPSLELVETLDAVLGLVEELIELGGLTTDEVELKKSCVRFPPLLLRLRGSGLPVVLLLLLQQLLRLSGSE